MDGRTSELEEHGRDDAQGGVGEHLDADVLNAYLSASGPGAAGAYPPHGLDPAARAVADAHLARCAACRAEVSELGTTVALLRALPEVAPRRSFILTPELVEAAGGRPRRPAPRLRWVWPVRWASALVSLLFVITVGLDPGVDTPTPSSLPATPVVVSGAATATTVAFSPIAGPDAGTGEPTVVAAGFTPTIFPTPTTLGAVAPAPAPALAPAAGASAGSWRAAEVGLGALASLLAVAGFLVPPFLRRRPAAGV
jgi:hypothetical protein